MSGETVIEISDLEKRYGTVVAADRVSFTVPRGVTWGLIGPDGAGKSTVVECLGGLCCPDGGKVRVLGLDPARNRREVFGRIGVQLQDTGLHQRIRVGEAVRLFASFHRDPFPGEPLLEDFGLASRADIAFGNLTEDERDKLLTVLALIGNPELLILDEPTGGLDSESHRDFWNVLNIYRGKDRTILLATGDMVEARENCDIVCVLDQGNILALGPPEDLLREHRLQRHATLLVGEGHLEPDGLLELPGVSGAQTWGNFLHVFGWGEQFEEKVVPFLRKSAEGEVVVRGAGLEDLYQHLTGKGRAEE